MGVAEWLVLSALWLGRWSRAVFTRDHPLFFASAARDIVQTCGHTAARWVVDLTSPSVGFELTQQFGDTPEGQWLQEHAHEFGFALSFPRGGEAVTGTQYEPWHYRYIGAAHAQAWADSGAVLLEYLLQVQE